MGTFFASLQITAGTHQHQAVTDYARPNQGTAHYQSTLTTVSTAGHLAPVNDQLDSMLGNLQADMSRQGVNTTQKGCCNACDKPIVGQVITALGKTWHPEHFTCNHCNQELGTRNFFERDGNPYCEPDYHNLFSPRCAYCNGPILDVMIDRWWIGDYLRNVQSVCLYLEALGGRERLVRCGWNHLPSVSFVSLSFPE